MHDHTMRLITSCPNGAMSTLHAPTLIATPIPALYACHVIWDEESQTISATVERQTTAPPNLARHIERTLFEIDADRRLVLGDLDILLDGEGHLNALEMRIGPQASWQQRPTPTPLSIDGPSDVAFDVDFDTNGIAVVETSVGTFFDAATGTLCFQIKGASTVRHLQLADKLCFGVDGDGRLTEILLGMNSLT
jgi:hypothetical protein